MVIEIETEVLKRLRVSAHLMIILKFLVEGNYTLLQKYISDTGTEYNWSNDLATLESKGLIIVHDNDLSSLSPQSITVTDRVRSLFTFTSDPFFELYNEYPTKVTRPDGKEEYLRRNYQYCNNLYNTIVRGNPVKHQMILDSLRKEVKHRDVTGTMPYMKTLTRWLSDKSWEDFKDNEMNDEVEIYGTDVE